MSFNQTFQWIFSGFDLNVSQCIFKSVDFAVQSKIWSKETKQIQKPATVMIHNGSFGSLDLKPGTKVLITQCCIDGEFKDRFTLITAKNSQISIQNCQSKNFINENGFTFIFWHNNRNITIENSVFIQHNSSDGVLLIQNHLSILIIGSLISQNVTYRYSFITMLNQH